MSEARPSESTESSHEPTPYDPPTGSGGSEPPTSSSPDESIPIDPPTNSGGGSTDEW